MSHAPLTENDVLVLRPFWWFGGPGILKHSDAEEHLAFDESFRPILELFSTPRQVGEVLLETGSELRAGLDRLQYLADSHVLVRVADIEYQRPSVEIEISSTCNADCIMCPREVLRNGRGHRFMSRQVFDRVLRNIGGRGAEAYSLCGMGESLLHPDWSEFVERIRAADPQTVISLYTNGLALNEETIEKIISSSINSLEISMQTTDPRRHAAMVRRGDVRKIMAAVELLLKRRAETPGRRLEINLVRVILDDDPGDRLTEWAAAHGVYCASWPMWNRAGNVGLRGPVPNIRPESCTHYSTMIFVDVRGKVLPCCCDIGNEAVELDAAIDSYETIYLYRLRRLASGQPLCRICRRCDATASNRQYLETPFFKIALEKALAAGLCGLRGYW